MKSVYPLQPPHHGSAYAHAKVSKRVIEKVRRMVACARAHTQSNHIFMDPLCHRKNRGRCASNVTQ